MRARLATPCPTCGAPNVFEDLGDFQAKGKTDRVRVYVVKGEIRGGTRLEVSRERGLTPLVGGRSERLALVQAFDEARASDFRRPCPSLQRGDL